ncbi:MAG: adenylate/guanylate cyclase domain-containing protein [Lachnospiraceae bacterium]|nr:adenylate/guanylate cyclase domain-containing protein [Lachnospiraceae bacterium]
MKKKTGNMVLVFALAMIVLVCQYFRVFQVLEYQLQDARYQRGGLISPEIYVIGIDEETLQEYGPWQNWGREKTAELITLLNEDETTAPMVIGLDIGFFGNSDAEDDQALMEAASLLDNVVTTSYATFGKEIVEQEDGGFLVEESVQTYEIPFKGFRDHVSWGFSNVPLDEDGIVRHSMYRFLVEGEPVYSFAAEIYRKYMGELPYQAEYGEPTGYIPFTGYPYDYYGTDTAGISFRAVLNGEIPKEAFAGCIVLIGPYSAGMMDSFMTAIKHDTAMFGVEVHANILQAFLDGVEKTELGIWESMGITALLILIVLLGWYTKKIVIASLLTLVTVGIYWGLIGIFYEQGYILPILYPVVGAAVIYISHVGLQYVQERKAKKHIQSLFGRYVSEEVVTSIVKGGEDALKLGGEKKDVAVLFVDIRGFTSFTERLEPEMVVQVLNRYLEEATKVIFDQKGTVDKFIGDAVMAIYNAPMDLDDYVFRAVKSGLAIAEASERLKKEAAGISSSDFGFGIGINCGEAVVGNIGTTKRMEYTAIGNTVNTAARLEGKAKAGEVIISPYVYERIKDRIEVTSLGLHELKGIREPVELYRVERVIENEV